MHFNQCTLIHSQPCTSDHQLSWQDGDGGGCNRRRAGCTTMAPEHAGTSKPAQSSQLEIVRSQ